jgi:hypothetical protein
VVSPQRDVGEAHRAVPGVVDADVADDLPRAGRADVVEGASGADEVERQATGVALRLVDVRAAVEIERAGGDGDEAEVGFVAGAGDAIVVEDDLLRRDDGA